MDNFSYSFASSLDLLSEKLQGWLDAIIVNLPNVILAIIISFLAYLFAGIIRKWTSKLLNKISDNIRIIRLGSSLSVMILGVLTLFIILSLFNLDGTINKLLATAGVLGLAVGLALQDPLTNLFSGVMMSVRDMYAIGDLVETNDYFGVIREVNLRTTCLLLPTGEEVLIPNKLVVQHPLKNYTKNGYRRIDLNCGISYGEDLKRVKEVAINALLESNIALKNKPIDLVFTSFGDSAISFKLRYWIKSGSQSEFLDSQSRGIMVLKEAFDKHGITIPFPIRTIDFGIKGGKRLDDLDLTFTNGQEIIKNKI